MSETENALEVVKSTFEAAQAATALLESAEKLSSVLGALGPFVGVAAAILKLALGNVDSPEMAFMKEQFAAIRNQLDIISDKIAEVIQEIENSTMNNQYFAVEENIKNQFRKYMDILEAAPEFREKEKEEFLSHFNASKSDQNLHTLYDGVMGSTGIFAKSILDTAMSHSRRDRRLMESLCARLKELFCIGLIALMGHADLTGNDVKALGAEWNEKMANVEREMKSMVDRCITEFAEQAEMDVSKFLKEKNGKDNKEFSSYVLKELENKYDWMSWSVRVYNDIGGFDNHCVSGPNRFHFFRENGCNIVVSYSRDPQPIDKTHIEQLMDGKNDWGDARDVATFISDHLTGPHVVHAVRRLKGLWGSWSFPSGTHFWENYSGVTLCVHRA
ncbi:protein rapunzel-like [Hypanus sabinus]|uniref:protein rapunzel-like n=1 Tax=Hypanus sabinus TaxID=79690 RepID=UPI0028C48A20|nr:protein rapunzel-like [Hypanus sabinus]